MGAPPTAPRGPHAGRGLTNPALWSPPPAGGDGRDLVVLVNKRDEDTGTEEKLRAHQRGGLLHRAVSVIVVNTQGQLMLQRRGRRKYHFAGLWTNTCCTHPRPGTAMGAAAEARLLEEMGFEAELREVARFLYRATDPVSGLTEHEIDHLFVGRYDGEPEPHPSEVDDWRWIELDQLRADMGTAPASYTPWLDPLLAGFADALGRGPDGHRGEGGASL